MGAAEKAAELALEEAAVSARTADELRLEVDRLRDAARDAEVETARSRLEAERGANAESARAAAESARLAGTIAALEEKLSEATRRAESAEAKRRAAETSAASPGAERISRRDGPFLSSAVAFTTTASPRRGTDAARCAWAEIFLRSETTRTLAAATAGLEVSANMTSG